MIPAQALLVSADDWTRDLLKEPPDTHPAGALLPAWVSAMRASAAAWDAIPATPPWQTNDIATGAPFAHAALAATRIAADTGSWATGENDPRAVRVAGLIAEAADSIRHQMPATNRPEDAQLAHAAELRAGLMHVGYLLTHATASSVQAQADRVTPQDPVLGAAIATAASRVRSVETILDAHLHRRPQPTTATSTDPTSVDVALSNLLRAAYTTQPSPGVVNNLVLADVARSLICSTARLTLQTARQDRARLDDVRDRVFPALETSARHWEAARGTWGAMMTAGDRPDPQLVAAATRCQELLRAPGLGNHPATQSVLTTALSVASEFAILNQDALTRPDLTAPAASVARLAQQAAKRDPDLELHHRALFHLRGLRGPDPIAIPELIRDQLATQGRANLNASWAAQSAGNAITDHSGYHPLFALHTGQARPPQHQPALTPERPTRRPAPEIR